VEHGKHECKHLWGKSLVLGDFGCYDRVKKKQVMKMLCGWIVSCDENQY